MTEDELDLSVAKPAEVFDKANANFKKVKRTGIPKYRNLHKWTYNKSVHLIRETKFHGKQNQKVFKRGAIVYVDFGINIGGEFSMPHFAIVLNKADNFGNEKLTVVPLTSKEHRHTVLLSNTIQDSSMEFLKNSLKQFFTTEYSSRQIRKAIETLLAKPESNIGESIISEIQRDDSIAPVFAEQIVNTIYPENLKNQEEIQKLSSELQADIPHTSAAFDSLKAYLLDVNKKADKTINDDDVMQFALGEYRDEFFQDIADFSFVINQYANYNKSTYARLEDITTISKRRIRKFNRHDPIGKIRVSSETLDTIERGIQDLFFK